jgi:hypothetical protein
MEVADERDIDAHVLEPGRNFWNCGGRFLVVDSDANELGTGGREGSDLRGSAGGIGCVGVRHGLNNDRMGRSDKNSTY